MRHLYRGSEQDCGPRAVLLVRRHGGILEQPASSMLWDVQGLLKPRDQGEGMRYSERDRWGGFSIEVDQVEWGHVARKRTWLYVVGIPWLTVARAFDARPYPGRKPTHYVSGSRHETARQGSPVPPGIKVCSATQRSRTPEPFAAWLVSLAGQVSL
jgi:hypothetical protein